MDSFSEDVLFWGFVILALLAAIYFAGTWNYGEFKKRGLLHSAPWPFFGNFGSFTLAKTSMGDLLLADYKQFKGHRANGFFSFSTPVVVVRDPELIRLVSVKDFDYFTDHMIYFDKQDDKLFGRNLFNLRGGKWKAMRNTLTPAFTSSKMKAMYSLIDKCGEQLADYLLKRSKDGVYQLEMRDLFSRYANDVIATSAYGLHCDSLKEQENEFYKTGLEITNFGGLRALLFLSYLVSPKIIRYLKIQLTASKLENFFCSIITETMATREREKIIRPDMIHLLMEARKGTLKGDDSDDVPNKKIMELSDDDISAQAFIFFLAGFDTSSTHLSFLAYQLAVNPEIQDKVRREIDEVLADNDGVLSYDAVQKMKYLDNVISETLRMWPPLVEIQRECVRDYVIPATSTSPAVIFKKGDGVRFPVFPIHRDPEYWPDPERFDPERFNDDNKHKIKPFTYMPFGTGPRACIGNRFALMETKIAMANVLSKVSFEVTEKTPIPIRLTKGTFNVSAEGGMWLGVKARVTS